MRSAQFIDVFYPHIDGVVTAVDNYARILNASPEGYSCVFAPENNEKGDGHEGGYEVFRCKSLRIIGGYLMPLPGLSKRFRNAVKDGDFDIVHAHSPFTVGRYAYKYAKRKGVPFVCTFHSKYYDDFLRVTHSKLLARMLTNYILRLYNKADAVWAVSPGTAQTLRDYGFKGDISVVKNGSDLFFESDKDSARKKAMDLYGLPEKGRNLIFVGSQIWQKNIKLIIDTMKILKPDGFKLISVGGGKDEEAIKKYARDSGVADAVVFTGKVSDRELLAGIYLCADMLFFPSEYDNAPLVLREASALGLPSMLLAGSNSADSVTEGVSGLTCPGDASGAAAAIKKAFEDPVRLQDIGSAAKETVSIPWETVVAEAEEKYKALIDSKR